MRRGPGFLRQGQQDLRHRRWHFTHRKSRETAGRHAGQLQQLSLQRQADSIRARYHLLQRRSPDTTSGKDSRATGNSLRPRQSPRQLYLDAETLRAEAGNIAESVEHLAWHEQKNILQPAMYSDWRLNSLLLGNHFSYVIGIPSGAAEAIELTLASQCRRIDDGRTIGFGNNPVADLSDIRQRMPFVLRAAAQFDEFLQGSNRHQMEQAI